MKLGLTEKQYNHLLTVISEAEPPPSGPETGTSGKQSGGQGYPQVGKWDGGVTRGPANQIGVTKWADVVGAKLTRGKGNQLKEQDDWWNKSSYDKGIMDRSSKYIDNIGKNWDDWGQWGLTIGSIAASFFIPGAQGLGISAGLDLIVAADQYFRQKDSVGAGVSTALAFIPYIGNALKVGKMSNKSIITLMNKFGPLKTKQQVLSAIKTLPEKSIERYTIEQILNKGPKEMSRLINGMVGNTVRTPNEAKLIVKNINKIYKEGKLTKQGVKNIFRRLGLQRFGFDVLLTTVAIAVGSKIKDNQELERAKKLEDRLVSTRIMKDTSDVKQSDLDLANDN